MGSGCSIAPSLHVHVYKCIIVTVDGPVTMSWINHAPLSLGQADILLAEF